MNSNDKRPIRAILAVPLIAALAIGAFAIYQSNASAAKTTAANTTFSQVVDVKQGNVSSTVSVVGQLEAVQSSDLYFDKMASSAKLLTLQVKAGNTVTAGQVLATIDPAVYQQAVDQARSNLQAAQEKLADLKTPATALQLAKADVSIAQANTNLRQAQDDLVTSGASGVSAAEDAAMLAQYNLTLAQLQQTLAEHDASAKTERDLLYAVDWHQRRINELQDLVANGKANLEQANSVATEQDALAKAQADLAVAQARRQSSLQAAAAKVTAAQAALTEAQDALATAKAGGVTLNAAKYRLAVQSAQVALASAQDAKATLTEGADAQTLAAAQADLDRKTLALADAEAALAGAKLTAPFSGTVLQVNSTAGSLIGAATKIMTVADLTSLRVSASIDETTIKKVSQGQTAVVTFDALPGQTIRGTVGEIPLQGALQSSVMVYQVPITLPGAEKLPLLVGMTANVRIQAGSAQNALLVPATAIVRGSGGYSVMKAGADGLATSPTSVPVKIGISDGSYTQITEGLSMGDKVVIQTTATASTQNNQRGGFSVFGFGLPFFR